MLMAPAEEAGAMSQSPKRKRSPKHILALPDLEQSLAQVYLGAQYAGGQGVRRNYKEAAKWYRLAAEQGDAYGQGNLGLIYEKGTGVALDHVLAHM